MAERCTGTNRDGTPCSAAPRPGRARCMWHDEALAGERARWRKKGGENKSNRARAKRRFAGGALSLREVQGLLCGVLLDVIDGTTEPGIATAAATVGRAIASVAQVGDLEQRIAELEERAGVADRRIA